MECAAGGLLPDVLLGRLAAATGVGHRPEDAAAARPAGPHRRRLRTGPGRPLAHRRRSQVAPGIKLIRDSPLSHLFPSA